MSALTGGIGAVTVNVGGTVYTTTLATLTRVEGMPSGRREVMFPGRYCEIFGRGERLGCILNLGHSFDAIEAYL